MSASAGWYNDGHGNMRWWDGNQWTSRVQPPSKPSTQTPLPVKNHTARVESTHHEETTAQQSSAAKHTVDAIVRSGGFSTNHTKITIFNAQELAKRFQEERNLFLAALAPFDGLSVSDAGRKVQAIQHQIDNKKYELERAVENHRAFQDRIFDDTLRAELQEMGIYAYHHPAQNSIQFKARLTDIQSRRKELARSIPKNVAEQSNWTINGSTPQGRKMVKEVAQLMLKAFNFELENIIVQMTPQRVERSVDRLAKTRDSIKRLGSTFSLEIPYEYFSLCVEEIETIADYTMMKAEEKEEERERRAQERENQKAQREIELQRVKLEKERKHYQSTMATLISQGREDEAKQYQVKVADLDHAIEDVDYRAKHNSAGYVYIISNIGSFGEHIVKIGMTRRLDPMDRVNELGDASVPFRFDVHALHFSEDAVALERSLHEEFAERRVNLINQRREFFFVTPQEAKEALLQRDGSLMEFVDTPEAVEYRQSHTQHSQRAGQSKTALQSGALNPYMVQQVPE